MPETNGFSQEFRSFRAAEDNPAALRAKLDSKRRDLANIQAFAKRDRAAGDSDAIEKLQAEIKDLEARLPGQ